LRAACAVADFSFAELVSLCICFNSSNEAANCVFFGGFGGFLTKTDISCQLPWQNATPNRLTLIADFGI